jgi:plasmid replication initiation protein
MVRKHGGRQPDGWQFGLRHLHLKSGSMARISDFALDIRRIAARQSLPGYRLAFARTAGDDVLRFWPTPPSPRV